LDFVQRFPRVKEAKINSFTWARKKKEREEIEKRKKKIVYTRVPALSLALYANISHIADDCPHQISLVKIAVLYCSVLPR